MKVFYDLNFQEQIRNPVLTIGNYDGIHIGHRNIIERVKGKAAVIGGSSLLLTFDPHPLQILSPGRELPSITPLPEKIRLIESTGIDVLLVLPFTREFGLLEPREFIKQILAESLRIKHLIIGYDFKFGREGKGDIPLLKEFGSNYGFSVEVVDQISIDHEKVGSNRIRVLVQTGDVAGAKLLLGRPYALEGRVVAGLSRGREIGYPTINLRTDYTLIPANGVYITEVEFDGNMHGAVTNIGYNPTFGNTERTIETFILDFQGSLYERTVRLHFLERLREEIRFQSVEELKARIATDVQEARHYLRTRYEPGRTVQSGNRAV